MKEKLKNSSVRRLKRSLSGDARSARRLLALMEKKVARKARLRNVTPTEELVGAPPKSGMGGWADDWRDYVVPKG